MNNYDFGWLIEDNIYLYIACLAAVGLIYYVLFKRIVVTFIDPFFVYLLSTVFAVSDVVIMALTNSIRPYYISSFFITQLSFLAGFFLLIKFKDRTILVSNSKTFFNLSYTESVIITSFFFLIFLVVQLSVYYNRGIPLLFESRLDYYNEGGGFGFMARVLGVLSMFVCFLIIRTTVLYAYRLSFLGWSALSLMFLFYVLTQVLSGGKSAILTPLTVFFSYLFVTGRKDLIKKFVRKYFVLIVFVVLLLVSIIISVQGKNEEQPTPLLGLLYRFIVSGDVYWYVYPNDVIKTYHTKANGFVWLFNDFLGLFRIISWSDLGTHPGVYFYNYHHPSDVTRGPNIRHNIFGLLYFGYFGAILYSFMLGVLLSFCRFFLVSLKTENFFLKFCIIYLFILSTSIEPDALLFFLGLNNLFIILPFLVLLTVAVKFVFLTKWKLR